MSEKQKGLGAIIFIGSILIFLGGLTIYSYNDGAIQEMDNMAFVPANYPANKIPHFVVTEDKRSEYRGSGTIYIRCPRNMLKEPHKSNLPEGYECRIYPSELNDETIQPLLQAKVMGLLDVYVQGFAEQQERAKP